jgi:transposase
MNKSRTRRANFQPQEKVAILRKHLLEGVALSDVCDEFGIRPAQFYTWQKQLFENGALVFKPQDNSRERGLERENARLRDKLAHKDEVIAEVTSEFVKVKKELGET